MAGPDSAVPDDPQAVEAARKTVARWIAELGLAEKAQQKWLTKARKIAKLYRKEGSETETKRKFAMLWSNTQIILPAVYARAPQPVVSRRFDDADPVGRQASEVLERALVYSVDKQDLDGTLRACRDDFILLARGQAWERYVPTHGDEVVPKIPVLQVSNEAGVEYDGPAKYTDLDGGELADDAEVKTGDDGPYLEGEAFRPVVYEEAVTDYVNWEDFLHSPARTWSEVSYVVRRAYLCRDEMVERFGEKVGKECPLDWGPKASTTRADQEQLSRKAAVYEIWDKTSRKVFWISKAWPNGPLDERDDPLGLDGFFPCPRPLLGTTANDSLSPVPDYVYYQDQAEEIDELTARIGELQTALKVRGFYAGEGKTNLNAALTSGNSMLTPVADWMSVKEQGGLKGMIEWMPLDQIAAALQACIALRKQLIEDVQQITGVSDILRGATDPNETATAQGIKAHWGSIRVRDRQNELARFARDIIRIKGEVIAEHFSSDTLAKMTGVKLPTNEEKAQAQAQIQAAQAPPQPAAPPMPGQPPQAAQAPQMGHNGGPAMDIPPEVQEMLAGPSWEDVQALLKDNASRQFRVDIETDSTIEPNESLEKQATVEFLGALGQMVAQWGPAVEAQPILAPVAAEAIKYAVRKFRAGRTLEGAIDAAIDQIAKQPPKGSEAAKAPTGKSPEELQIEALKVQQAGQKAAADAQIAQQRITLDAQTAQGEMQLKAGDQQLKREDQQIKLAIAARDPTPQVAA